MQKAEIKINKDSKAFFNNKADYCVGTGRMGLALQKAYQEQLKLVQDEIGFSFIRGHGLFSDDMAIYHEYVEPFPGPDYDSKKDPDYEKKAKVEYNFTYLDMVMDSYLEMNIRPFLELGFMPDKMASGDQTVFYWKGNVTPPKDYTKWQNLIKATLSHLMERYGKEEVLTWPIEVWNEPNLPGFWKDADMNEYFHLFKESLIAIKELNENFKVGGPAICGVDDVRWLREFLEFCVKENIKPDFITRHHYMFDKPEFDGHYSYGELRDTYETLNELKVSRELIDSYPLTKGLPMHVTEFNTSYCPNSPVHDTVQNAAYIAWQISHMGQYGESYSYWTFGDIFEEMGVPFTPFHGGFGLVANGLIKKPTFHTFAFFKTLTGECAHLSDNSVIVKTENGYRGVLYNLCTKESSDLEININIDDLDASRYCLTTKLVDDEHANPLKLWHDLGEPSSLSKGDLALLRSHATPFIQTESIEANDGKSLLVSRTLKPNAVMWFELKEAELKSDRGFRYIG